MPKTELQPTTREERERWKSGLWQVTLESGRVKKRPIFELHHEVVARLIADVESLHTLGAELVSVIRTLGDTKTIELLKRMDAFKRFEEAVDAQD